MSANDSATLQQSAPLSRARDGLLWGVVGVTAFSFTVPLTRIAVGGLPPLFIGSGRAVVAAALAAIALTLTRQEMPTAAQWLRIGVVAAGVVVGFPVLTSYALTATPASHGAVVIALLPAVTAAVAVLRTGERPGPAFWLCSTAGACAAVGFALLQGSGLGQLGRADLLLLAAVLAAAVGYAEGGLLAREIGPWQTVSWALVLASPLMLGLTGVAVGAHVPTATAGEWACFAYLSAVSMFLGFFAWYRGLAIGPMARVSQVQLAQPVMSICWAALLLGERIDVLTVVGGLVVVACAGGAVRSRLGSAVGRRSAPPMASPHVSAGPARRCGPGGAPTRPAERAGSRVRR